MTRLEEQSNESTIKFIKNRLKILGLILLLIGVYVLVFYIDYKINIKDDAFYDCLGVSILAVSNVFFIGKIHMFWKRDKNLKYDYKYDYIRYIHEQTQLRIDKENIKKWAKPVKHIP